MGQTLTNGIYLPNEGERNCYSGLAANWNAVDTLKGNYSLHAINVDIHVTSADKQTWNSHVADTTIHVTSADKQAWNGKADASALTAHTGDTTIHVTAEDKQAWNGKADASALTAHTGDTTIHVTAEDKEAWNGKADNSALTAHTGDTTIHVTAEDKAKWDAVTSKADDSDVVHKSGNETVGGIKTFDSNTFIYNSDATATTPYLVLKNSKSLKGNTSETGAQSFKFFDKNDAILSEIESIVTTNGACELRLRSNTLDSNNQNVQTGLTLISNANGAKRFCPTSNNDVFLGASALKWSRVYATNYYYGNDNVEFSRKFVTTDTNQTITGNKTFSSINGVEPSSLSLPNLSAGVDISGYITNLNKGVNTYTPPANGWLNIRIRKTSLVHASLMIYQTGGLLSSCETDEFDISGTNLPVIANQNVEIYIYADVLVSAKFYPCQGNI